MEDIFYAFLLSSAVGTASAAILFLIRPITRRIFSSSWHYYIWLVALTVMIFPIKLTMPKNTAVTGLPAAASYTIAPQIDTTAVTIEDMLTAQPIQQPEQLPQIKLIKKHFNTVSSYLSYIWLYVMVLLLLLKLLNYTVFLTNIHMHSNAKACPQVSEYTKRHLKTRVSSSIASPLVVGVIKPILLLPAVKLTPIQLSNILAHEAMHLKRNDLLYKWFVSLVKCICWYNPVVYFISRCIDADCEVSCDLAVVKNMSDEEKRSYIETILSLLSHRSSGAIPLTTGMTGRKKLLKRRFTMIKKQLKISKKITIISVIFAVAVFCTVIFASGILNGRIFNVYKNMTIALDTDARNGDSFNTLLLGVDEQNRADTIMLIMLSENKLTGISIPRNTLFDGRRISDILTQENGDQKVVNTIRNAFSLPITYYARVKIDMVKDLIDNNYGLHVDVPMDMKYDDPYQNLHIDLKKGEKQYLDGESVCSLLRYRERYPDGDLGRIKIGQKVVMDYLRNFEAIDFIANSKKVIESINKNVVTNYPISNYLTDKDILINRAVSFYTIPGATNTESGGYVYKIDYGQLKNLLSYD